MSERPPIIALPFPSPLLNDPEWVRWFRRLFEELLSAARDLQRFEAMPSYHNTILHTRWHYYLDALSRHLERAVDAGRKESSALFMDKDLWEAYQLAYAMMDDIAARTRANPGETPIPMTALEGVTEILARSKAATAPPNETPKPPSPPVILGDLGDKPRVRGEEVPPLNKPRFDVIKALLDVWPKRLSKDELIAKSGHQDAVGILRRLAKHKRRPEWASVIELAGERCVGYGIACS
jgi:hypothetical protein